MPLVLALEPDQRQAAIIKRLIQQVKADLVLVDSRDAAVSALAAGVPDVVLLTALLSPRDEEELVRQVRSLTAAEHLQIHTIPQLASSGSEQDPRQDGTGQGLLRRFRKKKEAEPIQGCDPDLFAAEVRAFLERAAELKSEATAHPVARPQRAQSIQATPVAPEEAETASTDPSSAWSSPFEWRHAEAPQPQAAPPAEPQPARREGLVSTLPLAVVAEEEDQRRAADVAARSERQKADVENEEAEAAPARAREAADKERAEADAARERERVQRKAEAAANAERERLRLEAEAATKAERERLQKEAEAAVKAERERLRLKAEAAAKAEHERLRKEAEAAANAERERLQKEAEAAIKAERERLRLKAEAEAKVQAKAAAKVRAEAEAALRAERERLRVEAEAAAKAERERLRLEAEAAAKAERERLRLKAEAAAKAERERLRLEAEAAAKAERERLRLGAEAAAKAELERLFLEAEAAARAERERLRVEAESAAKAERERLRLEADARAQAEAAAKARAQAEKALRAEHQRLRLEAEAAARAEQERLKAEAAAQAERERARLDAAAAAAAVDDVFAAFREEADTERGVFMHMPIALWARREAAAPRPEAVTDRELHDLLARFALPTEVANVAYASGCHIRRVRVPAPSGAARQRAAHPVILSRRALEDMRGAR